MSISFPFFTYIPVYFLLQLQKTLFKSNLCWKGLSHLAFPDNGLSLRKFQEVTQGRKVGAINKAETMEDCCLLTYFI